MIYEIDYFLSDTECTLMEQKITLQETTSSNFTHNGKFENKKWIDLELSQFFYDRLIQYISKRECLISPNKYIMSARYSPGEEFGMHTDTGLYYNRQDNLKTRWTLLIYLNTVDYGGETIFYDDSWNITKTIKPVKGKAILFDIELWHKANPILNGEKLWIGCEIIGNIS